MSYAGGLEDLVDSVVGVHISTKAGQGRGRGRGRKLGMTAGRGRGRGRQPGAQQVQLMASALGDAVAEQAGTVSCRHTGAAPSAHRPPVPAWQTAQPSAG